jgi:hypothetical protein
MFFLFELPLSTLFIALKPKDLEVIRNISLFVTKSFDVAEHLVVDAFPLGNLVSDGG